MQLENNLYPKTSFQGRLIAKTVNRINNVETGIDLWELSQSDICFLRKMKNKTDLRQLMPNLTHKQHKRWREIFDYAIKYFADFEESKAFLAVTDKKPCGIIVANPGKNEYQVEAVCTWPLEVGKKVKLAGKTLFYQIFKMFDRTNAKAITLEAVKDGPFPTVPKYKDLGFEVVGEDKYVNMRITKEQVQNTVDKLSEVVEYTLKRNEKDKILRLPFSRNYD